jgi:hypothetical protein
VTRCLPQPFPNPSSCPKSNEFEPSAGGCVRAINWTTSLLRPSSDAAFNDAASSNTPHNPSHESTPASTPRPLPFLTPLPCPRSPPTRVAVRSRPRSRSRYAHSRCSPARRAALTRFAGLRRCPRPLDPRLAVCDPRDASCGRCSVRFHPRRRPRALDLGIAVHRPPNASHDNRCSRHGRARALDARIAVRHPPDAPDYHRDGRHVWGRARALDTRLAVRAPSDAPCRRRGPRHCARPLHPRVTLRCPPRETGRRGRCRHWRGPRALDPCVAFHRSPDAAYVDIDGYAPVIVETLVGGVVFLFLTQSPPSS